MALTFDVSKIKDYERVTTDPNNENKWHPVTQALIFATMGIGMNEITEDNYAKFYARLNMWERVNGPFIMRGRSNLHEDNYILVTEVVAHIGLHTNATPLSDAKFRAQLVDYELERLARLARTAHANATA